MKKRSIGTILATALLAVGIGVGSQVFASEDTTNNISDYRSNAPEFSEVAPFMKEALPDLTEEQLEEWYNYHQNGARFGGMRQGMMRGAFGAGNAPEFSEVAPFMKEVFPDLTEEELEEWFNSRHSEDDFRGRGRGMMRGVFGSDNCPRFNEDSGFQPGPRFEPTFEEESNVQLGPRFGPTIDGDANVQPGSRFGQRSGARF